MITMIEVVKIINDKILLSSWAIYIIGGKCWPDQTGQPPASNCPNTDPCNLGSPWSSLSLSTMLEKGRDIQISRLESSGKSQRAPNDTVLSWYTEATWPMQSTNVFHHLIMIDQRYQLQ